MPHILADFFLGSNVSRVEELLQLCSRSLDILINDFFKTDCIKAVISKKMRSEYNKISNDSLNFNECRWLLQCYGSLASFYNSIGH
jgi:hypothetical protein